MIKVFSPEASRWRSQRGISLSEMMVTLAVSTTLLLVFNQTLIAANRAADVERKESQELDDLRTSLARFERELRWADQVLQPASMPGTGQQSRTLEFSTRTTGASFRVTYQLVPMAGGKAELRRTQGSTTVKLAKDLVDIPNPFVYYAPLAGTDQRGYIDVQWQIQVDPSRDPRSVQTRITMRNLV